MSHDNYLNAISEAKKLLTELLNAPEHGKLTFEGINGLNDLNVTGPNSLDGLTTGAVVVIDGDEWMSLTTCVASSRQWQCFRGELRVTSEELYLIALKNADDLHYAHTGDCSGANF